MPIVKWFFGFGLASSSKTALTIAGVNSLDDRPYRPAITGGRCCIGASPFVESFPQTR
jgi:hypothetical protein